MFAGNSLAQIVLALVVLVVTYVSLRTLLAIVVKNVRGTVARTRTQVDDVALAAVQKGSAAISALAAIALSLRFLNLTDPIRVVVRGGAVILLTVIAVIMLQHVLVHLLRRFIRVRGDNIRHFEHLAEIIVRIVLWIVAFLMILSNLGVNILSLVAGLGIGGIAVALAVQNILSDMFSSFSIYIDRPFRVGDFILTGPHMGTVTNIGIKTTRIRALQGEEIIIPNKELTEASVQNFRRMHSRRIQFSFTLGFATPPEQLKEMAEFVRYLVGKTENVTPERAHFKEFSESGYLFEVAYTVKNADYATYMDIQQQMNLSILEEIRRRGLSLAVPVRLIHSPSESGQREGAKM